MRHGGDLARTWRELSLAYHGFSSNVLRLDALKFIHGCNQTSVSALLARLGSGLQNEMFMDPGAPKTLFWPFTLPQKPNTEPEQMSAEKKEKHKNIFQSPPFQVPLLLGPRVSVCFFCGSALRKPLGTPRKPAFAKSPGARVGSSLYWKSSTEPAKATIWAQPLNGTWGNVDLGGKRGGGVRSGDGWGDMCDICDIGRRGPLQELSKGDVLKGDIDITYIHIT